MTPALSVITIRIDPFLNLGPVTLAWHGLTIALGGIVGGLLAGRWARERGLDVDPLYPIGALLAVGGIVGGRLFYLAEHGGTLLGTTGYTFYGGAILAAALIILYIRRRGLSLSYADAVAAGIPLGVAVGRIGDVINGEHYGPRSDFVLAVRNANPHAMTPDAAYAFQSGGLYEVMLALLIFAVVWPLRHRFRTPLMLTWLVIGLFATGRFLEFFVRADSARMVLGLDTAQMTSVVLLVVVAVGSIATRRRLRAWPSAGTARNHR